MALESLESVAKEVADSIAEDDVPELVDLTSETNGRPKTFEGHLLARARVVIGENPNLHRNARSEVSSLSH